MTDTLSKGIRLYRLKKYTEALDFFLNMPSTGNPEDILEVAYYIGLCYTRLEQHEEALLYLEQVVTACSDEERVRQCRLTLAIIYSQTGREKLADFELHNLLENNPENVQVLCALGYNCWIQEKTAEAISWYEKALSIQEDNSTASNALGYILACEGKDLTRALTLCKKAIEKNPDSAAYMDSLGWVYIKLGLLREAQHYLRRAQKENPENKDILSHNKVLTQQIQSDNSK